MIEIVFKSIVILFRSKTVIRALRVYVLSFLFNNLKTFLILFRSKTSRSGASRRMSGSSWECGSGRGGACSSSSRRCSTFIGRRISSSLERSVETKLQFYIKIIDQFLLKISTSWINPSSSLLLKNSILGENVLLSFDNFFQGVGYTRRIFLVPLPHILPGIMYEKIENSS